MRTRESTPLRTGDAVANTPRREAQRTFLDEERPAAEKAFGESREDLFVAEVFEGVRGERDGAGVAHGVFGVE